MTPLLLRNALLPHGGRADLRLAGGRIEHVGTVGSIEPGDAAVEDLAGALVLPTLVEGHIHLDKTLLGLPWMPHLDGDSVAERIEAEKRLRRTLDAPLERRAEALLSRVVAAGSTRPGPIARAIGQPRPTHRVTIGSHSLSSTAGRVGCASVRGRCRWTACSW